MKVFAVIRVTYDHHRFEDFKGVAVSREAALGLTAEDPELEVIEYADAQTDDEAMRADMSETYHWWLCETEVTTL